MTILHKKLRYLLIDVMVKLKQDSTAIELIRSTILNEDNSINDEILDLGLEVSARIEPKTIGKTGESSATVSLCMITKNEEHHLARCLASVDGIVDEIIVIDTGSSDRTREIATVFGAKLGHFDWTNDFSEARNISLSKASGDWIFVLDADETLSSADHQAFQKLISERGAQPVGHQFVTRNYNTNMNLVGWVPNDGLYPNNEAGNGWTSSEKVRLFPNDPDIRFQYPIHEMVEPSLRAKGAKITCCSIPIHHYGKLVEKTETDKISPYYQLGKKKLSEQQEDPNAIRELAIQAGIIGNHQETVDLWQRYISIHPNDCESYVYMGASYGQLGQHEEALMASKRALSLDPKNREARYNYGISQFYLGEVADAVDAFEGILQEESNYLPAIFMLGATYSCKGMRMEAIQRFEKLKETAIAQELSSRCLELTQGLIMRQMLDSAILLLEAAIESRVVGAEMQPLLTNIRQVNATATE